MRAKHSTCLLVAFAAFLAATGSLKAQPPGPATQDEIATAPVVVDGVALFRVRGVTSFPAALRAGIIRDRLLAVANDSSVAVDAIRAVDGDGVTRIVGGGEQIMSVLDVDASLEQVPRIDLANAILARIRQTVAGYRQERSPSALRRDALNALGATVVLVLSIVLLHGVWRWLDGWVVSRLRTRIHTVEIQSFELMRAERIWSAVRGFLLAIRALVYLLIGLSYLGFVLALFPWTRSTTSNALDFALGPLTVIGGGIVANIPSLVFLAVLFVMVRLLLKLVNLFFYGVGQGSVKLEGFDPDWAKPTYKIVRTSVIVLALVVGYPYIPGSQSDAFKGVSLFIGVVFSLGSSSAIANLIAGYMITYRRAFKVGDVIQIGDSFGLVIETRLQVTHLRSIKNEELIIPNSKILGSEIRNYSSLAPAQGLILHTEVGIGYDTPWRQVEAMLIAAAARTPGLETEPRPFVLEKKLGDFAVTYELNVYCRSVQSLANLYAELHRNILDLFNEYGVQIMTPAYEGDPVEPKVVPKKDWHAAPAAGPAAKTEEDLRATGVRP
jgi:small-conductance mechanosensitive channel